MYWLNGHMQAHNINHLLSSDVGSQSVFLETCTDQHQMLQKASCIYHVSRKLPTYTMSLESFLHIPCL